MSSRPFLSWRIVVNTAGSSVVIVDTSLDYESNESHSFQLLRVKRFCETRMYANGTVTRGSRTDELVQSVESSHILDPYGQWTVVIPSIMTDDETRNSSTTYFSSIHWVAGMSDRSLLLWSSQGQKCQPHHSQERYYRYSNENGTAQSKQMPNT